MKKRIVLPIIVISLIVILLLQAVVFYFVLRNRAMDSRPLVLIQNPLVGDQIAIDRGVVVHATAAGKSGLANIELWVDNQLVGQKDAPEDGDYTLLVLSQGWMPPATGSHTLTVRSSSKDGVTGQASIEVEVRAGAPIAHTVLDGESLESIAAANGITPDELTDLNDGLNPDQVQPGSLLTIPGASSGSGMLIPPGEASADVPPAGGAAPGSLQTLDILWPLEMVQAPVEPVQLSVEVLTLATLSSYESLHCYVGLAGNPPRWLPDVDTNQSTDESFASVGGISWGVAEHLANENALSLYWDGNESVPIDVSCVGVTNGGTESVRLGAINQSVRPENWGVIQHASSSGGEEAFTLSYRVTWPEKGLDTSITPPWNARLDESAGELQWDYLPNENGRPVVDGFAILLNDTFQWTVTGSVRNVRLPEQWFNLPCGEEYRFQLVSFNGGYPSGNYSLPSNTAVISGGEVGGAECGISVMVTLEQLLTGSLGGNPDPVYGVFFANDQQVNFDGRPITGDSFPSTFGLDQNSSYYISHILSGYGSGSNQFLIEIPEGRPSVVEYPLWVGFEIYKGGTKICSGDDSIRDEDLANVIVGEVETDYPMENRPDGCRVTYTVSPIGGSPVVDPGAPPPVPDLIVENLSVDRSSGRVRLHIRNVGLATWTNMPIVARVSWPDGSLYGDFEWSNMTLAPGETTILSHGGLNPDPALGVCVLLDPDNAVLEEYDRLVETGILSAKGPYCRPLADLSIPEASFNNETNRLHIVVQNHGETTISDADTDGSLDQADLTIWLEFADGRPLTAVYEDIDQGARESVTFEWEFNNAERERMREGYTIRLNPTETIPELDMSNNSFEVSPTTRLRLVWMAGFATFCPTNTVLLRGENVSGKNTWDMELSASIQGGGSSQVVADWNSPEFEAEWEHPQGDGWCSEYVSDWFEVAGDEELVISRKANLDIFGKGFRWFSGGAESLTAANDFGGTTLVSPGTGEQCFVDGVLYIRPILGLDVLGYGVCGPMTCGLPNEDAGIRMLRPIEARSDDITGYCWWTTTYRLFKEE